MEDQNIINEVQKDASVDEFTIVSTRNFIILSVVTFGLYELWWFYKAWRFFKQKDQSDIMPAMRVVFAIFFIVSLYNRIKEMANENGFPASYSPVFLFIGMIGFNLLAQLPDPFWMISLLAVVFMIQPFEALNNAIINSGQYRYKLMEGFSGRQIGLIIGGLIFWILVLLGFLVENEPGF